MEKENFFSKKYASKSSEELESIVANKSLYNENAVKAAVWELEKRQGLPTEVLEDVKFTIKENKVKKEVDYQSRLGIPIPTVSWVYRLIHLIIDVFLINLFLYLIAFIPSFEFKQLMWFVIYPVYLIVFEYKFQQTCGKMVTETIVVDKEGNAPNLKTIIMRTAIRYIPFEALSCFGNHSRGGMTSGQVLLLSTKECTEITRVG